MKKVLRFLFSRMVIVGLLIIFQALLLITTIWRFSNFFIYFYAVCTLLSIAVVLWIISNKDNPAFKLAWVIPILIFPIFGGLFYILFGTRKTNMRMRIAMMQSQRVAASLLPQSEEVFDELKGLDKSVFKQAQYIKDCAEFPVYQNTFSEYLSPGEKKFERMKEELEKAEKFIFMEYFIIEEGVMWDSILEILQRKVAQGVDVRLIYDDVGCLQTLPFKYNKTLEAMGIQCCVFNPFTPSLAIRMNNRDHRKICVIDGHTGFTGGINLADEYINVVTKHGHWKDAAIMIKGDAVWSLTVMFLTMWEVLCGTKEEYELYYPHANHLQAFESDGFVMPYSDSPLDNEPTGEYVYINMINRAKEYVYINTPYFIVDNEFVTALCLAAKSGIDVRIVTPHIADKWYVHAVTRAYYTTLIENGVKVYEYTPGFIHSKTFVCDDELGVVGTINLDYRSLYLHFECALWLYKTKSLAAIKEDFLETLKVCHQVTLAESKGVNWLVKCCRAVLRLFSPLM